MLNHENRNLKLLTYISIERSKIVGHFWTGRIIRENFVFPNWLDSDLINNSLKGCYLLIH